MKAKNARRALLMSVLSLLMCVSMLVGTTFAWFTDSVTSGSNIIKSGTLDIVLEYWDGDSWEDAEGKVIPFVAADGRSQDQILWEPGCTYEMAPIRVRNEGNLNTKFLILLNGVTGDEKLMEVIELKTRVNNIPDSLLNGSAGNVYQRFEDAEIDIFYGVPEGNVVFDHSLAAKGEVTPGTGHTDTSPEFTISGHMAEEAGNEYQNLAIEGISITVIATQETYESDSFNQYYDKNAQLPVVGYAYVDENAPATPVRAGKVTVTVPAGVPKGGYEVVVSNDYTETDANGVTTFSADIDLMRDGVKVEADGETMYLVEIEIDVDAGMIVDKVLHNGDVVQNHDYDPVTGIVKFETASFSPFKVIFVKNEDVGGDTGDDVGGDVVDVVTVTNADELKAALENVTEPVVIDAAGLTVDINQIGTDFPNGIRAYNIPGGVTIKNFNVIGSYRGGNYLMFEGSPDQEIVFENCTFEPSGRAMGLGLCGSEGGISSVVYKNCTFKGPVTTNFVDNTNGIATFESCTFTKAASGNNYVMAMGGTHIFNACTFDYTGLTQSSIGIINNASINSSSDSDGTYSTVVILEACERINCGTRKYGPNSTLTIK